MKNILLVALFLAAAVLAPQVQAQTPQTGSISGKVFDQTNDRLSGVGIELHLPGKSEHIETVSRVDGSYTFENVPVGMAELTFRLINFGLQRRPVTVTAGGTTAVDVVMVVSATASITITAPQTFRNIAELENPAENLVGVASSGSEGAITAAQLTTRPFSRPTEVLETVPGLVISQHSGEGKANQYYLRGFNLDHGYDFAQTIAGVPVNMPTHAHAQGYSDSNFLIPELVSGVQFRKGPYYAEGGDFSSAGSANINYFNQLSSPIVSLTKGSYNYNRFLAAASPKVGKGHLLTAFEFLREDGPWVIPNDHDKFNGVLRYSQGDSRNGLSFTFMGFSNRWHSTDQVPQRAIDNNLIPRFGFIEPTDGGSTYRYSLAGDWQRSGSDNSTRVTAYVMRYGLKMLHNFTYFLNDPVNGDQFEQYEKRWTSGVKVNHRWLGHLADYDSENTVGVEFRNDAVGGPLGLHLTTAGGRTAAVREDDVDQFSFGMFGESKIDWTRRFRTSFGLRGDVYRWAVASDNALNSGTKMAGIVNPKLTAIFGPWNGTELYANWGMGFHSNSGLGIMLTVDPSSGNPTDSASPFARAHGAEFGIRTVAVRKLQTTATIWYLGFDSELIYVGDSGTTEIGSPTRRMGLEITNYYHPHPWITVDFDLSFSRARFRDVPVGEEFVPGALNRVLAGGFVLEPAEGVDMGPFGSIRLRHFGPRSLIEDNSVKSRSTTIVNAETGFKFSKKVRLVVEGYNIFNAKVSDIDYFFTSRLPGEPIGGVDDIHLHAALPHQFRVTLRLTP